MAKLADSIQMSKRPANGCKVEFDFVVANDVIANEVKSVVNEFVGMVNIPGFRQGKAPVGMVKSKYESEISEELKRRVIYGAYDKLMTDKDLDVLNCNFEGGKDPEVKQGEDVKFTLVVEVAPSFSLGDYKSLKVELPLDAVTDEQIEERIKFYRTMYGNYAKVDGAAKAEDMLKVDYTSDFVAADDANSAVKRQAAAENSYIWLSQPESIPGCIAALTGAEAGKEYKFAAVYPADYREAVLAGKTVNYTVKVSEVQRREELNDEALAEKARVASLDEFRTMLRKSMETENESKRSSEAGKLVYEKLSALIGDFALPEGALQSEIQSELQVLLRENVKNEEDAEKFKGAIDEHKKTAEKNALDKLRRTFILRAVAKAENIQLESAEVDQQLAEMSRYYGYNPKEFRAMLEKNGNINEVQLDILNNKVLSHLVKSALA